MTIKKTIKTIGKSLLWPLIRPIWIRLWARIDQRVSAAEDSFNQHVPALLNAVSSVAALGYENAALRRDLERNVDEVWKRIEFVRKEMMYEFKYGLGSTSSFERPTRILSPEQLNSARSTGMKINLGCGHMPLQGYINVDQRELPGVDIIADVGTLPFENESVQEIFSAHVLEHFPQERLRRLLPYWHSLLAPQGTFRAIVPDGETMLAGAADGSYPFEHFREVLFGGQEYDGDFHFNLLTPDSLKGYLQEAGFENIAVPARGRKNDICFEFEIVATKSR